MIIRPGRKGRFPGTTARAVEPGSIFNPRSVGQGTLQLWVRSDLGITVNDEVVAQPDAFDNAAWSKSACSVSANATTDPFGGSGADSIIEDSATSNHFVSQTITNRIAGLVETWSIYAKAGTRNWVALGDNTGAAWSWFNLTTGALGTQAGLTSRSIVNAGNGWWKLTVASAAFTGVYCLFMGSADNTSSYTGNGTGNVFLFRAAVSEPRVSTWADQSGGGHNLVQGTAAIQPAYIASGGPNNKPYVQGDGVNDFMAASFTLTQPEHVFIVCKYDTAFSANATVIDGNGGNGMRFVRTADTSALMFAGASLAVSGITPQSWHAHTMVFNSTSSSDKEDGVVKAGPGDAGTNPANGVSILAFGNGASDWAAASISEIIVYSSVLSAAEETKVRNYLRARYGLP